MAQSAKSPQPDQEGIFVTVAAFVRRDDGLLVVRPIGTTAWLPPMVELLWDDDFETAAIRAAARQARTAVRPRWLMRPAEYIPRDVFGQPFSHTVVIWVDCEFIAHDGDPPPLFERAWVEPTMVTVHPLLMPFRANWRFD